jgi:hypothetical protein
MEYTIKVLNLDTTELIEIISGFYRYSKYWCEFLDWDKDFYKEVKEELLSNGRQEEVSFEEILSKMLEKKEDPRSYLKITDEADSYNLKYDDILLGIEKASNDFNLPLDVNKWDAASSDMIIQCALFGWTIYG